mmetsp:Transcript_16098/g.32192  ORF Transcript_16098/g.32192 Transcript_16098/m.32192 type:complete len:401 (-) Transcript_16098:196-1398(-)
MCTTPPSSSYQHMSPPPSRTYPNMTKGSSFVPLPRPSLRAQKQHLTSILLDSATTLFVLYFLYHNPNYLNPWSLPNATLWLGGFILIRCAIAFYDHLVVCLIDSCFKCKVLPTREPGAPPVRYVELDTRSLVYLCLNAFNEYAFVMRLTHYLSQGGMFQALPLKLSEVSLGNTLLALGIIFVSMDMLYAPLHHLMHLPSLYPLIHKHHHRQHFPTRGYLDAGNEHPIEHMIGIICVWFALMTAELMMPSLLCLGDKLWYEDAGLSVLSSPSEWVRGGGVHAITAFIFFQLHATLAMMNHSPYDVQFSLPLIGSTKLFGKETQPVKCIEKIPWVGLRLRRLVIGEWFHYSVGYHEMHHRKFNFNYGQYCMWYDLWMGTFLEYEGPLRAKELEAKKLKSKAK